jgi:hypothetical protein
MGVATVDDSSYISIDSPIHDGALIALIPFYWEMAIVQTILDKNNQPDWTNPAASPSYL